MDELLRGHYYHVYTDKKPDIILFRSNPDYVSFIHRASLLKKQHNLELLAYCLLPDHYHFIIGSDLQEAPGTIKGRGDMHPLSNFIYMLHYYYSEHYKKKYKAPFAVLEHEFNATLIDYTEHIKLSTCYLHFHPEKNNLVKDAKDWPYSSLAMFLDDYEHNEENLIDERFFYEEGEYERYFKDYLFNKQEKEETIQYVINT